jgi:hypothetical protein
MKRRSAQEKELADREKLTRAWRKWHREQLEVALDGMHGDVMHRLMDGLKELRSARELVDFIAARDWSRIDANTRLVALHEINRAITELREHMGLDPIDDALPGEPLRAFQLIKAIIDPRSFPQSAGEARPKAYGQTVR